MKNEITLQRYTIELLIKALENGAKDNVYNKGQLSILKSILSLFDEEGK